MQGEAGDENGLGRHRADMLAGPASDAGFGLEFRFMEVVFTDGVNRMGGTDFRTGPAVAFFLNRQCTAPG